MQFEWDSKKNEINLRKHGLRFEEAKEIFKNLTMTISKKRLKEIESIQDEEIDYSDIPATDEAFWEKAELKMPEPKQGIFIRLDADVLEWFKKEGKGYQTRINAILRSYYEAHKNSRP